MIARWLRLVAGSALGMILAGCAFVAPLPAREDVLARLKAIPVGGAPLSWPMVV